MAAQGTRTTKFGAGPFAELIRGRGYTVSGWARANGLNVAHVCNAALGRVPPGPLLRDAVIREFGLPLDQVFTPEAVAANLLLNFGRPRSGAR